MSAAHTTPRQAPTGSTAPAGGVAGRTTAIASAGTLLMLTAFTTPLTTIAATSADLGLGPGAQAWVLSATPVGTAVALLSSGAVGDERGRRVTFVLGAMVLAAASLLGALAPSAGVLIAGRLLQGLGGAAVLACGLGLIGHVVPAGAPRLRATGVWGAAIGAGVAVGPLLAAGLDALGGWRLPYAVLAGAALVLGVAARVWLPESRAEQPVRVDVLGAVLFATAVAALLSALVEGRTGWTRTTVLVLVVLGIAAAGAFALVERRATHPMLDPGLLRRPAFVGATVGALASGAGPLALMSLVPTVLVRGLGQGTVLGAVVLLAWSATSAVTALWARHLPARFSPRAQIAVALVGVAVGQLAVAGLRPESSPARLLPGLFVVGAANGLLNAALGRQAVATVPANRTAMGSGANNTARYVGSALGIAAVTVLLTGPGATADGPAGVVAAWDVAVVLAIAAALLGALTVLLARERNTDTASSHVAENPDASGPSTAAPSSSHRE